MILPYHVTRQHHISYKLGAKRGYVCCHYVELSSVRIIYMPKGPLGHSCPTISCTSKVLLVRVCWFQRQLNAWLLSTCTVRGTIYSYSSFVPRCAQQKGGEGGRPPRDKNSSTRPFVEWNLIRANTTAFVSTTPFWLFKTS